MPAIFELAIRIEMLEIGPQIVVPCGFVTPAKVVFMAGISA
jgi:hypothetical protein